MEIQVLYWKCARLSKLCWGSWTNFRSFSIPLFMDSSLWQRNLDSGFKSLVEYRIPWSVFRIPKTHDSGFHKQNFPRFRIRQTKISLIPESGFLPRGLIFTSSSCGLERKVWRHVAMVAKVLDDNNRELTITAKATRTGKKNWFIKQNNNFAHAMFIHFSAIIVRLRHETSYKISRARFMVREHNTKMHRLFLNLDAVLSDSTLENFAKIWQIKWNWIRLTRFEAVRIHILSEVFGLLSSRNFATVATWLSDFSPLLPILLISYRV